MADVVKAFNKLIRDDKAMNTLCITRDTIGELGEPIELLMEEHLGNYGYTAYERMIGLSRNRILNSDLMIRLLSNDKGIVEINNTNDAKFMLNIMTECYRNNRRTVFNNNIIDKMKHMANVGDNFKCDRVYVRLATFGQRTVRPLIVEEWVTEHCKRYVGNIEYWLMTLKNGDTISDNQVFASFSIDLGRFSFDTEKKEIQVILYGAQEVNKLLSSNLLEWVQENIAKELVILADKKIKGNLCEQVRTGNESKEIYVQCWENEKRN